MLENETKSSCVSLKKRAFIKKKLRFNLEVDESETKIDAETRLDTEFGELVHILITKKENASSEPRLELPDTIEEIKEQYNIFNPGDMAGSSGVSSSKQAFQAGWPKN